MLYVILMSRHFECHFDECSTECRNLAYFTYCQYVQSLKDDCYYAECQYAECRNTECR